MKKDSLESISRAHVDHEHSIALEENKDIGKKLEKILQLISKEEKEGNSEGLSQLVVLIENFYESYKDLYGRYDHLVGKINKSSYHNQEMNPHNVSFSESSDSETSERQFEMARNRSEVVETEAAWMLSKLREGDLSGELAKIEVAFLENELQRTSERIKALEAENGRLGLELEASSVRDENEALISENSILLKRLQEKESSFKELEIERELLKDETVKLKNENADLKQELEITIKKVEENSDLKRMLEGEGSKISALEKEISHLLQTQKSELEEHIRTTTDNDLKGAVPTDKSEKKLISKISFQERMLNRQKGRFDKLSATYKLLEEQFRGSCLKFEIAQAKIEQMEAKEERICQLEMVVQDQKMEIDKLEEKQKELLEKISMSEAEKAHVDKEIAKLHELIQTLELHLHLSNQKFKITKSEYKEKDENQKRRVKELQQKCRELEDQNLNLYEELHYMDVELSQIKEAAQIEVITLTDAFQHLELIFEESCRHFQTKLCQCSDELRIMIESLQEVITKKQELEKEKSGLLEKVEKQEGIVSMLRKDGSTLAAKLAAMVKEEERLVRAADGYQKRMQELEKRLKEKEEESLLKDQEKREAIRQLCLLIDYHRENYNHLIASTNLQRMRKT